MKFYARPIDEREQVQGNCAIGISASCFCLPTRFILEAAPGRFAKGVVSVRRHLPCEPKRTLKALSLSRVLVQPKAPRGHSDAVSCLGKHDQSLPGTCDDQFGLPPNFRNIP